MAADSKARCAKRAAKFLRGRVVQEDPATLDPTRHGVMQLNLPAPAFAGPPVAEAGERMQDLTPRLGGSESTHEIIEYGFDGLDLSGQVWTIPGSHPRLLSLFGGGRYLAAMDDRTFSLRVVDTESGTVVELEGLHSSKCFFERKGALWIAWGDLSRPGISFDIVSFERGTPVVRDSGPLIEGSSEDRLSDVADNDLCAFDPSGDYLFFTGLLEGRLTRLRLSPLPRLDVVLLGRGIRYVSVEPSRRLLAVSNYLTGYVSFLGADDLDSRGEVFLGPRVRWLDFASDGRAVYAASSAGVFVKRDGGDVVSYVAFLPTPSLCPLDRPHDAGCVHAQPTSHLRGGQTQFLPASRRLRAYRSRQSERSWSSEKIGDRFTRRIMT